MRPLTSCKKTFTTDLDKAIAPAETIERARNALSAFGTDILEEARRIDTGRLGIPVYMSLYGPRARRLAPSRKQMGKGASPQQAEASALMELIERYSFFSFWNADANFYAATYSQAYERFGDGVLPIQAIIDSVDDTIGPEAAVQLMDLHTWRWCPALEVRTGRTVHVPIEWFKLLNEFNGSSAGNTPEEAVLQGACEVVERHVSALVDAQQPELPTIDPASISNLAKTERGDARTLADLLTCYATCGVTVLLKDMSLGQPVPTVGAIGWDPATFPEKSEIVFTAGTASSPVKAAIRALTEVAQLAGDFETQARYEPSGLSKYETLEDIAWLQQGPLTRITDLPSVEDNDIAREVAALTEGLAQSRYELYAIDTTSPELAMPAVYTFIPGMRFRERSASSCVGLFVGRVLAEKADVAPEESSRGLATLAEVVGTTPYVRFLEGMAALTSGDERVAALKFEAAAQEEPAVDQRALARFYTAYALTRLGKWAEAETHLSDALHEDDSAKEYFNLRGVCRFRAERFAEAAEDFAAALRLDKGSAMDLANLGMCHKRLGNTTQAMEYLSAAMQLDPSLDFAAEALEELLQ